MTRSVAFLPCLDVIAEAMLTDRSYNLSLTLSPVCQGRIAVEYGQMKPLQVIKNKRSKLSGVREFKSRDSA